MENKSNSKEEKPNKFKLPVLHVSKLIGIWALIVLFLLNTGCYLWFVNIFFCMQSMIYLLIFGGLIVIVFHLFKGVFWEIK
jgi:hypothetical protein